MVTLARYNRSTNNRERAAERENDEEETVEYFCYMKAKRKRKRKIKNQMRRRRARQDPSGGDKGPFGAQVLHWKFKLANLLDVL